jgi:hypothetical protein
MGIFSGICHRCNKPVNVGQAATLTLLKAGKEVQTVSGNYDGYGFGASWDMEWASVVRLMFLKDKRNGIAFMHYGCAKGARPRNRSKDDVNQGLGEA